MIKFSRRRLLAALSAPVVTLIQYPYTPKLPPMTDDEQDQAIRENAGNYLFLWGMIQLSWSRITALEKDKIDPLYMQKWEKHRKSA